MNREADRVGCDGKLQVVGREGYVVDTLADEQRTRQMDRIEGSQRRGERLRRSLEDPAMQRDEGERFDRFQDRPAAIGHLVVLDTAECSCPIDRPQALQANELAGDGVVDPRPDAQPTGLREDHSEENR